MSDLDRRYYNAYNMISSGNSIDHKELSYIYPITIELLYTALFEQNIAGFDDLYTTAMSAMSSTIGITIPHFLNSYFHHPNIITSRISNWSNLIYL